MKSDKLQLNVAALIGAPRTAMASGKGDRYQSAFPHLASRYVARYMPNGGWFPLKNFTVRGILLYRFLCKWAGRPTYRGVNSRRLYFKWKVSKDGLANVSILHDFLSDAGLKIEVYISGGWIKLSMVP